MQQDIFSSAQNLLYTTLFAAHHATDYWPLLSLAEQKLALQRVNSALRDRVVLSYGLRRKILADLLARDPKKLTFAVVVNKKPVLVDASVHFNVAHSDDHWALMINQHHAVGVDIESMKRDVDFLALAERFFSQAEADWIKNAVDGRTIFWQLWTAKEALLKASGIGLHGLDDCSLSLDEQGQWQAQNAAWQSWQIEQMPVYEEAMLAAAIPLGQELSHICF